MGSDACFQMGASHTVCQDYAVAGAHYGNGIPYAIVSDGCSGTEDETTTGAPFTDYGSRFIARAARIFIDDFINDAVDLEKVVDKAKEIATAAQLPPRARDATLIVATRPEPSLTRVHVFGDGVVAARSKADQKIVYHSASFGGNAPFYPNFLTQDGAVEEHVKLAKTIQWTTAETTNGPDVWTPPQTVETQLTTEAESMRTFTFQDCDLVLLMTDGVESFQDFGQQRVQLEEILIHLFAVRCFNDQFITRRCNKFLKNTCSKHGWRHLDDLSVAAIACEDPT